jgi:glucose/arabinose dehydrogenase
MKNMLISAPGPSKVCVRYAVIALVVALGLVPHAASAAMRIKAVESKLCLGAESTSPLARAQILACNQNPNQDWESTGAGELRTFNGTRCLDVRGASTEPRASVISHPCNGGANQKWNVKSNGDIVGVQSGLCLTVKGGGTDAGTETDMRPCRGVSQQKWVQRVREDTGGPNTPDTQAPTPPGAPKIADLACRSVTLSWTASTDNVGVAFYDVYHDGQQLVTVSGNKLTTPVALTPGAKWNLYVNARDAVGNVSQASATLPVMVPQCTSDTQPPTVPSGLTGAVAGTTGTLDWNASTDNVGVTAYDVYRNDVKVGSTPNLKFTDSGLAANTSYRYTVTARDGQDNTSERSVGLRLTTGGSCSSAVCSVSQAVRETDIPWGLITLPDGDIIYSRRDALDLVRLNPGNGKTTNLGAVPNSEITGAEGGLLGLAVTPNFPDSDQWIYIYHTSPSDNRIVRIKYINGALDTSSLQVLLTGIGRNIFHNGGRLRFGPDGKLYAATGDAQNGAFAQDKNKLSGKVLRLNPNGSVPSDNPFGNYVWSYGHRNPQGLAFDSQGRLWEQEFGEKLQDETNLIVKGGNYGWPDCEGTASKSGNGCQTAGFIAPKYTYTTSNGSCSGIAIVREAMYVACLQGARVYRHVINGNSLTNTQELFSGTYGRLRTVEPTIDGGLWMTTSNSPFVDKKPNNSDERVFKVNLGN